MIQEPSRQASALQPIDQFVTSTRKQNPDNRALGAVAEQRYAEADIAKARYLPSFTAQGIYTHNEYEIELSFPIPNLPSYLLVPRNQFDGLFTLAVPLIQVAAWQPGDALLAAAKAADARRLIERARADRACHPAQGGRNSTRRSPPS